MKEKSPRGVVMVAIVVMAVAILLIAISLLKLASRSASEGTTIQPQPAVTEKVTAQPSKKTEPEAKPIRVRFTNISVQFIEPSDWKNLTNKKAEIKTN